MPAKGSFNGEEAAAASASAPSSVNSAISTGPNGRPFAMKAGHEFGVR
jgi:hypothetical protein